MDCKLNVPGAINMGGDSGSESGEIMRNIMKAEPCTTIETRVGDISAGKVGCADLRGLDQNRKE